ncbi:hypothetical protein LXL04_021134 [Taraxacum kok-saghyz]
MQNLKKATKEYAREIGLGHLLQMKVDGSPTKIGYYAVKNFDPKNMVLKVNNGVINITREHVHKILGLPLGHVKIDNMEYWSKEDKTVDDWYDQFDGKNDITPHAVKEAMSCAEHPDLMFKVNLFVLLCNTLAKTNSMDTCDVSMLPKVTKDLDLSNFDRCSYVLKCLEDTRFSWNESSATSYYFGPIILLTIHVLFNLWLLYVECVRFDGFKIERGIPAICYWTVANMRKREDLELSSVGLGTGEIIQNIGQHDDATEGESIEGYLLSIEDLYDQLLKSKLELDAKIKEATEKHPDKREISLAPTQWWYDNEEELNRSIEMAINSWGKSNQIIQTPLNKTTINRQISPIACPSFSLGLTHEMSNTIGKTPTNFKFLTPTNNIPCPVPVTMVQGDIPVKRQSKKSRILCSPYIERATDITKALSRQEKMLGDLVASLQGESEDTIFRAMSSFTAHRYHMESLLPKCMLFAHVIDCWSLILNADEVMRDPQSPFRLFCQTDVAGPYLSDPKISDNDKQLMFSRNMWDSIKESDRTLRSVSLIFLPVVASVHIYLIVVDLRDTDFVIIDNSKTDVPMHIKYGDMPNNITFMGCEPGEFKSGFKTESAAQDLQLQKLRFRYMNRIMSGHNLLQRNNLSEADDFSEVSAKVRTNMLARAQDILCVRLAQFG